MTFVGRQPLMEDGILLKTTLDGRWHLMEDDHWWKMTFDGRWHLMEDDLRWKTTFDGRRLLTEDDLWRKTTFNRRRALTEDDLWRKTYTMLEGTRRWTYSALRYFFFYKGPFMNTITYNLYWRRKTKPKKLSFAQFSKIKHLSVAKLSSTFPYLLYFSSAGFVLTSSISSMSMTSSTM